MMEACCGGTAPIGSLLRDKFTLNTICLAFLEEGNALDLDVFKCSKLNAASIYATHEKETILLRGLDLSNPTYSISRRR